MIATASVSTVIPCFRCTLTLERAVESVAAQTVLPREIILVDDGSGDGTRALMARLQNNYAPGWIRLVLLDTNVGAAAARNAGWDQAASEYVAFLDADDAWHSRKIELQVQFMNAHPEIAVSGHGHRKVTVSDDRIEDITSATFENVGRLYLALKNPFVTPSIMVRTNVKTRFLHGKRYMEDHFFLMQLSMQGLGIAKASAPLAYIFKAIYGESGLSADLRQMHRNELDNYRLLGQMGWISQPTVFLLLAYSWLKFLRRYLIVCSR